jgi:hypothetical protein
MLKRLLFNIDKIAGTVIEMLAEKDVMLGSQSEEMRVIYFKSCADRVQMAGEIMQIFPDDTYKVKVINECRALGRMCDAITSDVPFGISIQ